MPRYVSLALRIIVSVVLIGLLVGRLDFGDMGRFLLRADLWLVGLTLMTVFVDRCLMAGRWILLLEALGLHGVRRKAVKIFFLSTFFGSFLPTGIGGEAVRALSFSRLTSKGVESIASVAMDRLLGLLSMLLTGLAALVLSYHIYPYPALLATVLGLSAALIVAMAILLSERLHRRSLHRLGGYQVGWRAKIRRGIEAMARYRGRPQTLMLVLGMSVGVQLLRVVQAYLLSEAMGLATPVVYFFCFVPPILIVTMLPISVSGLGTTNWAYVGLFSQVGMDPNGAFVLSILILALGVIGNLPGGVIYAVEGLSSTEASTEAKGRNRQDRQGHAKLERAKL